MLFCMILPTHVVVTAQGQPTALSQATAQKLVRTVLKTEDAALHPTNVWMRYRLRKSSPRLTTTKWIVETRDGDVAHLIAWNDQPLTAERSQLETSRIQTLLADPSLQRHREQREAVDTERLRKIIHALPEAFIYRYAGILTTPEGAVYRLTFQPNPSFNPFDLETQVLKGMAGELWINVAAQRVVRLQCSRIRDVDYGLGLFAKLDQGGTLLIEQHRVTGGQWRITRMVLKMNARVLFREIQLDTQLELTEFAPVPSAMDYRAGIALLRTLPEH